MKCNCEPFMIATWVSAEAADSNLSIIDTGIHNDVSGTSRIRFVPKLAHVSGLTTSSTLLCSTDPVVILGVIVGNVLLASV